MNLKTDPGRDRGKQVKNLNKYMATKHLLLEANYE